MKKLLKDQKENFHATSKMMRKMREEKNLQKKAERESKLNRKYADDEFLDLSKGKVTRISKTRITKKSPFGLILWILYIGLLFSSCGTLSKQVSKDQSSIRSESALEEHKAESSIRNDERWLESWMQQLQYTSVAIYSDSIIRYQPGQGFAIDRGHLIFTQLSNLQEKSQENAVVEEHSHSLSDSKQTTTLKTEEKSVRSDKERSPPSLMIWIGAGVLVMILVWDWYHKRSAKQGWWLNGILFFDKAKGTIIPFCFPFAIKKIVNFFVKPIT